MQAITYQGIRKVALRSVPEPEIIDEEDVIVKVACAAICGSDMHIFHGRETGLDVGTIMGHEFSGTVIETGEQVEKLNAGDRVASPFTVNCGVCYYCKMGLTARCEKSQLLDGSKMGKDSRVCIPNLYGYRWRMPHWFPCHKM